jgi:hypothetical protein
MLLKKVLCFHRKDAELFSKRCGAFLQKMRSFSSKDAELFFKRCGAFYKLLLTNVVS